MDDLIQRLTAAVDGLAALAQRVKDVYVYPNDHERAGEGFWPTPRVAHVFSDYPYGHAIGLDLVKAFGPDEVLRGCAADRKLLAIYRDQLARVGENAMEEDRAWTLESAIISTAERYGLEVTSG